MASRRQPPQFVTRLTAADQQRFRELANTRGVSYSSLLREAVLQLLAKSDSDRVDVFEGVYAAQLQSCMETLAIELKKSVNRICALQAKGNIDTHAIYLFLSRIDESSYELMKECTGSAVKRLTRKLGADEKGVATGMVTQVSQAS